MKTDWFLIINPTSGNGKSHKIWKQISNELNTQNIQFSFGGYEVQWNGLSVEEILFSYVADGSAITITDYPENSQGVLTIPATMFGKPVTKIGAYTFQNCGALTKILIPESVTQIEIGAFRECSSLTEAIIPDSVTSLGNGLFW